MDRDNPLERRGVLRRLLVVIGICGIILGLTLLVGALLGLFPVELFQVGGESGYRVIGTVAVFGCMIAALGYSDD